MQLNNNSAQTKQFLNVPFELKGDITSNEEFFFFEGYASVFGNVDLGNDVIEKGAFTKSLAENSNLPILWGHKIGEPPIGNIDSAIEDNHGLFIKAKLPKSDTFVSGRIMPQVKTGSIQEMSIGYFTNEYEIEKDGTRKIKEINLFEVSLVTKAMNPKAKVTGFKSLEEINSLKDVEITLKSSGFSNTESKTLISKIKEFSIQRDAEEKQVQRDAELKSKVLKDLEELTNFIKTK